MMIREETLRRVAITGASGFIGSALVESLRLDGIEVLPIVRRDPRRGEIGWDPEAGEIDAEALRGVDALVHLAGENIGTRWTEARKRRVLESRARGTRVIAEAIGRLAGEGPRTLVSASGVGYYGDRGDDVLTEDDPPGDDFLARVCIAWEAATEPARDAGARVVNTRFGVVLHPSGGALALMMPPFKLGIGGRLGDGRQWMSWVWRSDAVAALRFALAGSLSGPLNVTAPEPIRNEDFTRVLGDCLRRPTFLAVPAFALRLVLGEMADTTLLVSLRAVPARLEMAGFAFRFPTLSAALQGGLDAAGRRCQTVK